MPKDYDIEIAGHTLEYLDEKHVYLVDGIIVPSITSLCKRRLGDRYPGVPRATLQKAADRGTEIHEAIERFCKTGSIDREEVYGFRTVTRVYGICVLKNEVPVILFGSGGPVAAGRLDLVIERGGRHGIADVKTTAKLDREYLSVQLNLYAKAYEQCYGHIVEFLAGIHVRGDQARLAEIPLNREFIAELIKEVEHDQHDDGETA